ncbi:hypothetical protein B0H13DRAFT_2656278 [Mycena leptocephala]|nr:hypothetical protein B0H13DRAFT_2656278 [Mycena leptocephala]
MATPIQIVFEGFPALLTDTIVLPQSHSLLLNRGGDRVPKKISFELARTWGYNDGDASLIYAQAQSADGSTRFCLRFILNAKDSTSDRTSMTFDTYARLIKDAIFHSRHLVKIEGILAPRHYGITQWCGESWNKLSRIPHMNTEANRILVGCTMETLHDFGVTHGGLVYPADLRHLILDVDARGFRVTTFSVGKPVVTSSTLPTRAWDTIAPADSPGCAESEKVTYLLGFMKTSPLIKLSPDCETYKALQWHDKYSKHFPDLPRANVLIAQRAKLYSHMPPLYPELIVSFDGSEEYSKVAIARMNPRDKENKSNDYSPADSAVDFPSESAVVGKAHFAGSAVPLVALKA